MNEFIPEDCDLDNDADADVCVHGIGFDEVCVECCPEDDDGLIDD